MSIHQVPAKGHDTVDVTLVNLPQPNLGNDVSICLSDPIPTLNSNVSSAQAYQWYLNGVIIAGAVGQTYQPTTAGTYSVLVSTAANCDGSDTLELIILPSLPVALGPDQTICANDPAATLNANVSAASYQWYLNGSAISGAVNQTHQATQSGTYSVIATSVSGCTGGDTAQLVVNAVPGVSLGPDTTVCALANYGLNAGNSGATFQWLLNGSAISGANSQMYTPTQTGTYSAVVTNSNNCTDTGNVIVTLVNQAAQPTPMDACANDPMPVLDAGVTNVGYWWINSNNDTLATTQQFQPSAPGTYTVVVHINGSCENSNTATIYELPSVGFTSNYDADPLHNGIHLCEEDDLEITVTSSPSASSYIWTYTSLGGSPLDLNNNTPVYMVPQLAYGEYEIEVTDVNGCVNRIHIEVEEECELTFHNVITPNFDGYNDYWVIENFDPSVSHSLNIYNRWGNEVFTTSSYKNDWYGVDLPHGVYYYVLNYNGKGYNGNHH